LILAKAASGAAAKKGAAKRAWRPKSREETPKEGSNPMRHQVAMHKLVVASHKIKGPGDFFSLAVAKTHKTLKSYAVSDGYLAAWRRDAWG
jgi:hypothetical protein